MVRNVVTIAIVTYFTNAIRKIYVEFAKRNHQQKHCRMDVIVIYLTVSMLMFIATLRFATGIKRIKVAIPGLANYLIEDNKWNTYSPVRLLTMCVLVSLLSCADFYKKNQQIEMKMKQVEVYQTVVLSIFVVVGARLQSPMLIGPWLGFTLKNLLQEISFITDHLLEPMSENFVTFAIFWTFTTFLWLVQFQWFVNISSLYSFLWNDVFDRVCLNSAEKLAMDVCLKKGVSP